MKILLIILFAFTVLLLFNACSSSGSKEEMSRAQKAIQKGSMILDVRTPAEFSSGHLPNAINIPHTEIASHLTELSPHRNDTIVLYCRSGHRSGIAQQILIKDGFTDTINGGGFSELKRSLETSKDS